MYGQLGVESEGYTDGYFNEMAHKDKNAEEHGNTKCSRFNFEGVTPIKSLDKCLNESVEKKGESRKCEIDSRQLVQI